MDIGQLSDADLLSALNKPDLSSMSDADLLKAIGQEPKQNVSTLADVAKSGIAGVGEGITGLAGAPADIANLAAKGVDYLTGTNLQGYTQPLADYAGGSALKGYAEKVTGPFYKPQTGAGEFAQTVGQFAPAVIGGPETLATKLATRVAAPAVGSEVAGKLTEGTGLEPYARFAGAVAGAGLPVALSRGISPTTINPANASAINTLESAGVGLTAGQKSGSRALKYAESELGDALGAGGKATATNEKQAEQFTSAVLNKIPVTAGETRLTQGVFDKAIDANGQKFDAVINRNPTIPLQTNFAVPLQSIANDYEALHGTGAAPILGNLVNRINSSVTQTPAGAVIPGAAYQAIQSDIAKFARSAGSNGYLRNALYDLRDAFNNQVSQGLTGRDAREFAAARNEYRKLLVLERIVSGTPEGAARGFISPAALANAEKAVYTRRAYARGTGPFSQLANAGNAMLKPLPQSGTAPRAAVHFLPSVIGGAIGSGVAAVPGVLGGALLPGLIGRALLSGPGQRYLANQAAVPLRQIPLTRNMITSGVLGLPPPQ